MNDKNTPKKTNAPSEKKALPKLLSDKPEKKDFFGAHTSIARTLMDLVLNDDEGRCVAIEGAWGSGKSTVIGILTEELVGRADMFVFDTWSNQGDPLRFSFMSEFVAWVKEEFPKLEIKTNEWQEEIEETARQTTKEVTDPVSKKFKEAEIITAALFIGLPVGLALASDTWGWLFRHETAIALYITGLALVFIPLFYLGYLKATRQLDFFKALVSAITNAADETKKIIVRRGPLATSLEFDRTIKKICKELHKENPSRKILIIFDNIDRVARENSPRVWSLLTSLLEAVHDKDYSYAANIWVLVPVDLDTVPVPVSVSQNASQMNSVAAPITGGTESSASSPERTTAEEDGLKHEFIEKTFQLTVVVPPPLSVASERYFEDQYKKAFGGTDAEVNWSDSYAIVRAEKGSHESIAPRTLKRFINDLVGLWRARYSLEPDDMPSIALMSFYLCARDKIKHPNDINDQLVGPNVRPYIRDENLIASLAALAFGARIKYGLVTLVSALAADALDKADIARFGNLVNVDGFAEAFAAYISDNGGVWLRTNTSLLARAYAIIGQLDDKIANEVVVRFSGVTKDLIEKNRLDGRIDVRTAEGMALAAAFVKADTRQLQSAIKATLVPIYDQVEPAPNAGEVWLACAISFLRVLRARSISFDSLQIDLPTKKDSALQALRGQVASLYDFGEIRLTIVQPVLTAITGDISVAASQIALDDVTLHIVKSLRRIVENYDTVPACNSMLPRLQNINAVNPAQYAASVAFIDDTVINTNQAGFSEQVKGWITSGFFLHHYQVTQGDKSRLAAGLSGLMAGLGVQLQSINPWNQSHPGRTNFVNDCNSMQPNLVEQAFKYLCDAERFHDVIRNATSLQLGKYRENLLIAMLKLRPDLYDAKRFCEEIVPIYAELSDATRTALDKYAVEILQLDVFLEKSESKVPPLKFADYQRIGATTTDVERKKNFYIRAAKLVNQQPHTWWNDVIQNLTQPILKLVSDITSNIDIGWLGSEVRNPLENLILGQAFLDEESRRAYAKSLLAALNLSDKSAILVRVVNKAISVEPQNVSTEFRRIRELEELAFSNPEVMEKLDLIVDNVLIRASGQDASDRSEVKRIVGKYDLLARVEGNLKKRLQDALEPPQAGDKQTEDGETKEK